MPSPIHGRTTAPGSIWEHDVFSGRINGTDLPPADQLDTVIDAGPYLHSGTNTLEVRIATTLANAVSPRVAQQYGLLGSNGEVTVVPYTRAVVA